LGSCEVARERSYAQRFMSSGIEILGEFALGDVGNESDTGVCCAEWARGIKHGEVAAIPCAAAGSGCVAEGGQELEEDGRGMSLRVGIKRVDDLAGQAIQGPFAQMELRGRLQWDRSQPGRWFGLRPRRFVE
jgi:hypothetical protein